ncbi:MFS transporter [Amycolatopsis solani]|uniref:MFS transporter n=1 Tax=Amycolatopsis solani TaxID=3028615 RepID=UPI0025B26653|nr:MFS transporter [Amycolatopsis sp. MEP2-6]
MAVALVVASMTALYSALPGIAVATGATQGQLTWVIDGYTLALACLVLTGGALGDRYGRRATLFTGLLVFSAGSAVPLAVSEPAWLIGGRVTAGVGAALVMPSTLSLLTGGFPAAQRGRAVGVWAGVVCVGALIGLLGSGLLLQSCSWRAIFFVLTAAGTALTFAALTVPESRERDRPRVDIAGAALSAVAVGLFVGGVTEAPARGWLSPGTLAALVGCSLATAAFIAVERRREHALLPVRLFGNRSFATGVGSLVVQFLASFGMFLLLQQYLQLVLGYTPTQAAIAMAPLAVPLLSLCLVASRLTARVGLRVVTVSGLAVLAVGLFMMSGLEVHTTYGAILRCVLVVGAGLGLCTAPATSAIIAGTPAAKHGVASAVNDSAREVGAAIGIAVAGSVLAAGYRDRIEPALPGLAERAQGPVTDSPAAALAFAEHSEPGGHFLADLARAAFVHGFQQAMATLAVVTAAGALAAVAGRAWTPGNTVSRRWRRAG